MTFEFDKRPTIKGYPELRWTGKRPYESTQYYPAQLRERYGEETNGWINKIFWGDNLQVMSHLLYQQSRLQNYIRTITHKKCISSFLVGNNKMRESIC